MFLPPSTKSLGRRADSAAGDQTEIEANVERGETAIYRRFGLPYILPELRENDGELEAAAAGRLPELVTLEDIQGMTHCHTDYSDGANSIEEMALAAVAMGMKYLTITDHSPTAFYARGVQIDRLWARAPAALRARTARARLYCGVIHPGAEYARGSEKKWRREPLFTILSSAELVGLQER